MQAQIPQRRARLRAILRRRRLGGVYLTRPEDVRYFSGFTGADSALLVTRKRVWLITDPRYTEEAEQTAGDCNVLVWKKHPARFAGELAAKQRFKELGYCAGHLTVAAFKELKAGARGLKLHGIDDELKDLRALKDAAEVRAIGKALRCAEGAFEATRAWIKPGMREIEVRAELEMQMRRRGASDAAFETIVASGANASRPHAHAGKRKLKAGGLLLIDFGALVDGYNSDLTRVLFLGMIHNFWREKYLRVLDAQRAGIAAILPGATCAAADAAARAVFQEAGCGAYFSHGLGHGVGLAVHEAPRLSVRSREVLQPGHVVTVEPGLYYPRRGGIRIEDIVLITETGRRRLSRLPRDIEAMVV